MQLNNIIFSNNKIEKSINSIVSYKVMKHSSPLKQDYLTGLPIEMLTGISQYLPRESASILLQTKKQILEREEALYHGLVKYKPINNTYKEQYYNEKLGKDIYSFDIYGGRYPSRSTKRKKLNIDVKVIDLYLVGGVVFGILEDNRKVCILDITENEDIPYYNILYINDEKTIPLTDVHKIYSCEGPNTRFTVAFISKQQIYISSLSSKPNADSNRYSATINKSYRDFVMYAQIVVSKLKFVFKSEILSVSLQLYGSSDSLCVLTQNIIYEFKNCYNYYGNEPKLLSVVVPKTTIITDIVTRGTPIFLGSTIVIINHEEYNIGYSEVITLSNNKTSLLPRKIDKLIFNENNIVIGFLSKEGYIYRLHAHLNGDFTASLCTITINESITMENNFKNVVDNTFLIDKHDNVYYITSYDNVYYITSYYKDNINLFRLTIKAKIIFKVNTERVWYLQ